MKFLFLICFLMCLMSTGALATSYNETNSRIFEVTTSDPAQKKDDEARIFQVKPKLCPAGKTLTVKGRCMKK